MFQSIEYLETPEKFFKSLVFKLYKSDGKLLKTMLKYEQLNRLTGTVSLDLINSCLCFGKCITYLPIITYDKESHLDIFALAFAFKYHRTAKPNLNQCNK